MCTVWRRCCPLYCGSVASAALIQVPVRLEIYRIRGGLSDTRRTCSTNGSTIGSIIGEWKACEVCSRRVETPAIDEVRLSSASACRERALEVQRSPVEDDGPAGAASARVAGNAVVPTFSNGRVDQANFPDYPLLSMSEMPQIVSVLVDSDRPPQGVGEVMLAPVAPAVAGAILQASGTRIDRMPFPNDLFAR